MNFSGTTAMNALAPLAAQSQRPQLFDPAAFKRQSDDQHQVLADQLAKRLGLKPEDLAAKASDYTPAKVAERIIGFIDGRLRSEAAAGADTTKLQGLLNQARAGVEKGFADAKKILDGMGVLGGKIASDIDDTYSRIQDGLAGLDQQYGAAPVPAPASGSLALAAYSERFEAQAQSFELNVTTRDGDKLRISIAQASANWSQSSVAAASNGQGSALLASNQSGSLQMGAWQISVEGELDAEERASLEKLFSQVQDLSNKFYAGDLQGAFDRAMDLDLDGDQLASMSLRLTQTHVRQATDAYSSVAQQGGQQASAVNSGLLDYARGLLDALRSASELADNAHDTLSELLQGGFAMDERFDGPRLDKANSFNERLLAGLSQLLEPQTPAQPASLSEAAAAA